MKILILLFIYFLNQSICLGETESSIPIGVNQQDELPSPTADVDQYEQQRKKNLEQKNVPHWSINITTAPFAFRSTNLRVPSITPAPGTSPDNPKLFGLLFSGERVLFQEVGLISVGIEAGAYGTSHYDQFSGLAPAFWAAGPYFQYQALYFQRQWVVPTARTEYEVIRYSYHFANTLVENTRGIFRVDVGLMLFLNFLEPSAAADISSDYGVKRTYLVGYYSMATDSDKTDFDLTDNTFKIGLRFEF